jgi:hypothetical protein
MLPPVPPRVPTPPAPPTGPGLRLGLVSDTHGRFDPALPALLAGVAAILHAGDVGDPAVLEALERLAPVRAVRGNNDVEPPLSRLPEVLELSYSGADLHVRHVAGTPARPEAAARRALASRRPRVLVCGHSHRWLAQDADGTAWLNPGSCGPRRFSLPRTAAVLELGAGRARFLVTDLDTGAALGALDFAL